MRRCRSWWIALAFLLSRAAVPVFSQGTLADYERAEKFLPANIQHLVSIADVRPHWIEKSNRFWYRMVDSKGSRFVLVDADRNTADPAFDHARLAESLARLTRRQFSATDLPFEDIELVEGGAVRFEANNAQWTCSLSDYGCKAAPADDPMESVSPDKRWSAFVQDHNLYLRNVSTGARVQLTRDGVAGWDYATPLPWLKEMIQQGTQDVKQPPTVFWSPNSSKLVCYRIDSRNVTRLPSIQYVPPDQLRPKLFTVAYTLPGEVLPLAEPIVFDVASTSRIDVKSAALELPSQEGPDVRWSPDSKMFVYDYDDRGFKAKEIRMVDSATGEQKTLVRESAQNYVDPGETFFRFDYATGEIFLTSARDGWNHLYLYNKAGQLLNQVTQGAWGVRRIEYVDEKNRRVFFLGSGREKGEDPYQTHLYSVGFDGKGLTLLSPENADHEVSVSPDGSFFVDNYSRPDLPGQSVLRRSKDGMPVRVLEQTDAQALLGTGWKNPEPFQGKAGDGTTDLYGMIWRPTNFDPSRKYPIVEQVYTGPQGFFVPKTFAGGLHLQSMAELGFVVVMVDGRGTAGRSRAFHEFSYRNLGGAFADHVAMIKQMADRYSSMDINRVGIYGNSAGGYGAAHAMLVFPEFYKVGLASSGDHDARLDKTWWNELYQGYPVQDDYVAQSNVTMAGRLQGHLLLEHGDVDENVHPAETMRFVDALIKANKNFDMLFVPNMFHGEGGNPYLIRRRWDYFVQYLLGVTPPAGFQIKTEPRTPGSVERPSRY
jgi:dipeptidyl-peptidase 4